MFFCSPPNVTVRDHSEIEIPGNRILYACVMVGGAYGNDIISILEYSIQQARLVPPPEIGGLRVPGAKHAAPRLIWLPAVDGVRQLRLYYASRPDGATSGAFRLTYFDLPFYDPAPA